MNSPEDVVHELGREVWFPQVSWSNPRQDYVCLRAAPGTISSVEKKKLFHMNSYHYALCANLYDADSGFRNFGLLKGFNSERLPYNEEIVEDRASFSAYHY